MSSRELIPHSRTGRGGTRRGGALHCARLTRAVPARVVVRLQVAGEVAHPRHAQPLGVAVGPTRQRASISGPVLAPLLALSVVRRAWRGRVGRAARPRSGLGAAQRAHQQLDSHPECQSGMPVGSGRRVRPVVPHPALPASRRDQAWPGLGPLIVFAPLAFKRFEFHNSVNHQTMAHGLARLRAAWRAQPGWLG